MQYISNEKMLDMLKKIQPLQVAVLKSGRTAHLDASIHEDYAGKDPHIGISFTVFEGYEIVKDFDFFYNLSAGELETVYASLVAYVETL